MFGVSASRVDDENALIVGVSVMDGKDASTDRHLLNCCSFRQIDGRRTRTDFTAWEGVLRRGNRGGGGHVLDGLQGQIRYTTDDGGEAGDQNDAEDNDQDLQPLHGSGMFYPVVRGLFGLVALFGI